MKRQKEKNAKGLETVHTHTHTHTHRYVLDGKLNITKPEKILLFSTIFLVIIGILSKFIQVLSFPSFVLFGVWALYFLGMLIFEAIKINNIKLNYKSLLVIAITSAIAIIIYAIVVLIRKDVYAWDQCTYYLDQLDILSKFKISFFAGIKEIIKTTYMNDYGYFLLSFTSLIFNFTNKTGNAFVITYTVVTITSIIAIYYSIIKKLVEKYELKNKNIIILLGLMLIVAFPLLHKASIAGQPDFMGLIFIGLIILLTMDYDFKKIDIKRCILIFISTLCLLITRRWYLYWVASYYVCYALILCIKTLINKDYTKLRSIIKNLFIFGTISIIIGGVILAPMIYRIVKNSFFSSYTAWNIGGLSGELKAQFGKIGGIYFVIMALGIIYGIKNRKFRAITIQMLFTGILTLFLFTRLQNMGNHHSLLLVPTYIYSFLIFIIAINQIDSKFLRRILQGIVIILLVTTLYGSLTQNKSFFNNKLYTDISLKPNIRKDYEVIAEIDKFILENCDVNHKAYINAASGTYCANVFENYILPDMSLQNIIPYEASINSAHGFPLDIFETKYMFISNIHLEATGAKKGTIIEKLKYAVTQDEQMKDRWKLVKEFKMTDEVTFYAYERVKEFDEEEANYYIKLFEEESNEYPDLFNKRIEKYLEYITNRG